MSTYYFVTCKKHQQRADAASWMSHGVHHLCDSAETLPAFLVAHRGCELKVVSEHEDAELDGLESWTEKNLDDMFCKTEDSRYPEVSER